MRNEGPGDNCSKKAYCHDNPSDERQINSIESIRYGNFAAKRKTTPVKRNVEERENSRAPRHIAVEMKLVLRVMHDSK